QLRLGSSGAGHLGALSRTKLNGMHRCTGRDVTQRKRIAHQDVGINAAGDLLSYLETIRLQDVALLAVGVAHKSNVRRTVRVIFHRNYSRWNSCLVALEIDDAILLLVSATAPPRSDVTAVSASTSALLGFQ